MDNLLQILMMMMGQKDPSQAVKGMGMMGGKYDPNDLPRILYRQPEDQNMLAVPPRGLRIPGYGPRFSGLF